MQRGNLWGEKPSYSKYLFHNLAGWLDTGLKLGQKLQQLGFIQAACGEFGAGALALWGWTNCFILLCFHFFATEAEITISSLGRHNELGGPTGDKLTTGGTSQQCSKTRVSFIAYTRGYSVGLKPSLCFLGSRMHRDGHPQCDHKPLWLWLLHAGARGWPDCLRWGMPPDQARPLSQKLYPAS